MPPFAAMFDASGAFRAGPADLDAFGRVPNWVVLRWLQDLRMQIPGLAALLRAGSKGDGARQRVVVKAQVLRWAHAGAMNGDNSYLVSDHGGETTISSSSPPWVTNIFGVTATLRLGRVGRSSLELHYSLRAHDGGARVAEALVVLVVVGAGGRPVRAIAIPEAAQPFDAAAHNASLPALPLRALIRAMLPKPAAAAVPAAAAAVAAATAPAPAAPPPFAYHATVRPSDEDANMHMNHASYARLFGDARAACVAGAAGGGTAPQRTPVYAGGAAPAPAMAVAVEYVAEARFPDRLAVQVGRRRRRGGGGHCDDCACTMTRANGGGAVVSRGRLLTEAPLRRIEKELDRRRTSRL